MLFIDASKGFAKAGKSNKLMASDIKRIVDTVAARPQEIKKYARRVTKAEIRKNGYNLNIPRYIDSSEEAETWDIYATMFGGIPNREIDRLDKYWTAFPRLREDLFSCDGTPYSHWHCRKKQRRRSDGSADVNCIYRRLSSRLCLFRFLFECRAD